MVAGVHQEVGGLDVAVGQLAMVDVGEGLGRLKGESNEFARRCGHEAFETRAALDEFHRVVGILGGLARANHLHDVRVVEIANEAGFLDEGLAMFGIRGEMTREHLDGATAVQRNLHRFKDRAHAAIANLAFQTEFAAEHHRQGELHLLRDARGVMGKVLQREQGRKDARQGGGVFGILFDEVGDGGRCTSTEGFREGFYDSFKRHKRVFLRGQLKG